MRTSLLIIGALGLLLSISLFEAQGEIGDYPPLPPAYDYGNLLINRTSEKNNVKPATFSHWIHRQKHTCRICHFELGFKFKLNATEITEAANKEGRFCGTAGCHDDKTVYDDKPLFGHTKKEDCEKCHNGNISYGKDKFEDLKKKLPPAKYGNEVNWIVSIEKGMIKPVNILKMKPPPDLKMVGVLRFAGYWNIPLPPVVFSHKKHSQWLDCNNCHPDLFPLPISKEGEDDSEKDPEKNPPKDPPKKPQKRPVKSLGEKHAMSAMGRGESCGLCHLKVAFPLNDCPGCHPGFEGGY